MQNKLRYLLYMLRIRRLEFRIAEIPILVIPLFLLMRDVAPLKTFALWEGIFIFFLLFAFGDMINCLADRDLDAVYKPHLSEAVYGLGVGFVTFQVIASAILALALTAHLSWLLNRWLLLPMVGVGLLLGAAYSVKPFQLKGRGLAQVVCLWLIIFFGPMLFIALLLKATPSVVVLLFAASFGALQMGIILVNTAEDYPEDLKAGINTSIVSLGLHRGIGLSFWLTAVGAVGVVATLVELFLRRTVASTWFVLILPAMLACAYVLYAISKLNRTIAKQDVEAAAQTVKVAARSVPVWLTVIAWTTLVATGVIFMTQS